jgi:D-alanyl-lipoteichoic acid acyltransferase DltB (MBOAT superfamily)
MDDRNWNNNKVNYGEVIARLMMILVGFMVVMLGFITFIHSGEHRMLGLLIMFGGLMSMFGGLPHND